MPVDTLTPTAPSKSKPAGGPHTATGKQPRRIRAPRPDMRLEVALLGWNWSVAVSLDGGNSVTRSSMESLELRGELPESWKRRKLRVSLYPDVTLGQRSESSSVGSLLGDKEGWAAVIALPPGELARATAAVTAAAAKQVSLFITKPHYRHARILYFSLDAASGKEFLPEPE